MFFGGSWVINEDEKTARKFMQPHLHNIKIFGQKYMKFEPSMTTDSIVQIDSNNRSIAHGISVTKVLSVEESIWSPVYGIKGNLDVAVEAKLRRKDTDIRVEETYVFPLEIKTGKENVSNAAQVMIYSLLMSDYYGKFSKILVKFVKFSKILESTRKILKKNRWENF